MPPKEVRQARKAIRQAGRTAAIQQRQNANVARQGARQDNRAAQIVNQGVKRQARVDASRPVKRQARQENITARRQQNQDIRGQRFIQNQNRKNLRTEQGRGQQALQSVGQYLLPGIAQNINAGANFASAIAPMVAPELGAAQALGGGFGGASGGAPRGAPSGYGGAPGGAPRGAPYDGPSPQRQQGYAGQMFDQAISNIDAIANAVNTTASSVQMVQNLMSQNPINVLADLVGLDAATVAQIVRMSRQG